MYTPHIYIRRMCRAPLTDCVLKRVCVCDVSAEETLNVNRVAHPRASYTSKYTAFMWRIRLRARATDTQPSRYRFM